MHCCGRVFKREFSFLFFTPPEEWVALAHEKINVALPVMRQVKSKMMENWERQYDLYWLTRNWGKEEEEKRERESYLSPGELGSHDPKQRYKQLFGPRDELGRSFLLSFARERTIFDDNK